MPSIIFEALFAVSVWIILSYQIEEALLYFIGIMLRSVNLYWLMVVKYVSFKFSLDTKKPLSPEVM